MGDMAEAKYEDDDMKSKKRPVMQKLNATLGKAFARSQEYKNAMNGTTEYERKKLINTTLKGKNKIPEDMRRAMENSDELDAYKDWLGMRSSNLEKLHFIIGHGLLRTEMR